MTNCSIRKEEEGQEQRTRLNHKIDFVGLWATFLAASHRHDMITKAI